MTTALPATGRPRLAAGRLLRIELRHNAMMWLLPVVFTLFWLTTYHKTMALAPMWNLRAASLQSGTVIDFITPVVGASAWMGSREARRRLTDIVTTSARPPWARLLATWAATACWALAGYLICLAVLYGVTASQASGSGPLWWPVAVAAASVVAFSALGFAAGVLMPSRFTAPIAGIAALFVLALSTQLIVGSRSYWQISPIVTGPWDSGPDAGVATFYPYLPDLSIAQLMFLGGLTLTALAAPVLGRASGARRVRVTAAAVTVAGLLAAGTAVRLAGTSHLDAHGMIAIPALHDAANDRPVRFTPDCSHAAIPVCLNPAYARYLPAVTAALRPAINEVAGLPGAPGRISQVGTDYQQCRGNGTAISAISPPAGGAAPMLGFLLPDQEQGPPLTTRQVAAQVGAATAPALLATVIGGARGGSQAKQAVWAGLVVAAGQRVPAGLVTQVAAGQRGPARSATPRRGASPCESPAGVQAAAGQGLAPRRDSARFAVARRFAALPAAGRRSWLVAHLPALRAGRITLAQIP